MHVGFEMKNEIPHLSSIRPVYFLAAAIVVVFGVMTSDRTCLVIGRTSQRVSVRRTKRHREEEKQQRSGEVPWDSCMQSAH